MNTGDADFNTCHIKDLPYAKSHDATISGVATSEVTTAAETRLYFRRMMREHVSTASATASFISVAVSLGIRSTYGAVDAAPERPTQENGSWASLPGQLRGYTAKNADTKDTEPMNTPISAGQAAKPYGAPGAMLTLLAVHPNKTEMYAIRAAALASAICRCEVT
jgi:hypothetical protein